MMSTERLSFYPTYCAVWPPSFTRLLSLAERNGTEANIIYKMMGLLTSGSVAEVSLYLLAFLLNERMESKPPEVRCYYKLMPSWAFTLVFKFHWVLSSFGKLKNPKVAHLKNDVIFIGLFQFIIY